MDLISSKSVRFIDRIIPATIEKSDTPHELPHGDRLLYCLARSPGLGLTTVPYAEVAQVVEQWTENPCVGSSSLPLGTILSILFFNLSVSSRLALSL